MIQKGNPHQLPRKQHIFPVQSIRRFCNDKGGVEVYFKNSGNKQNLRPEGAPFYVKELWDAKAEGHLKQIEDQYQSMIAQVNPDGFIKPNRLDHDKILKMYASWYARAYFEKNQDQKIQGITGVSRELSIDAREQLEKAGAMTIGPDLTIRGRQMAWRYLLMHINDIEKNFKNQEWGILTAGTGEFLVPDKPPHDLVALPLSPRHIFCLGYDNQTIPEISVIDINLRFIDNSDNYYFANSLKACPR